MKTVGDLIEFFKSLFEFLMEIFKAYKDKAGEDTDAGNE